MSLLARRSIFAAVLASGAALFATGVQGVAAVDTKLQIAAQRTDDGTTQVRYDERTCPAAPDDPRV